MTAKFHLEIITVIMLTAAIVLHSWMGVTIAALSTIAFIAVAYLENKKDVLTQKHEDDLKKIRDDIEALKIVANMKGVRL